MSGPGGGPAPAAPTAPGTSVRTGCQTCPQTGPCDCAKLVVRAEKSGAATVGREPSVVERELSTTRKLRGTPLSQALRASGRPLQDFEAYDLVIECVAGFIDRGDLPAHEDRVTLKASAEWEPSCSSGMAHLVSLRPLNHLDTRSDLADRPSVATRPLYLDLQALDLLGGDSPLGALLGGLAILVGDEHGSKTFAVRARSCGVRPGGATPNGDLTALFVLYRKMKVELVITLPPAREAARIRGTGSVDFGGGARDVTFASRSATQRYLPGLGRVADGQVAASPVGRTNLTGLATQPELGRPPSEERVRDPAPTIGQDTRVQLKINGRELDCSEWVRRILRVKERVESVLDGFVEMIQKAPQVGWRLEYTYQLLTGSLAVEYERIELGRPIDGRLLPAPKQLAIRADLTLIKLQGTLSFGVHFEGWWGTALGRIYGSIGGEVKTTVNFRIPGGERKWTANGAIPIEVGAVGELRAGSARLVSVQASASSGFELETTIFDDTPPTSTAPRSSEDPWKLDWKLKLKKCTLTGRVEDPYTGFLRISVTRELWGDRPLWPRSAPR